MNCTGTTGTYSWQQINVILRINTLKVPWPNKMFCLESILENWATIQEDMLPRECPLCVTYAKRISFNRGMKDKLVLFFSTKYSAYTPMSCILRKITCTIGEWLVKGFFLFLFLEVLFFGLPLVGKGARLVSFDVCHRGTLSRGKEMVHSLGEEMDSGRGRGEGVDGRVVYLSMFHGSWKSKRGA